MTIINQFGRQKESTQRGNTESRKIRNEMLSVGGTCSVHPLNVPMFWQRKGKLDTANSVGV